MRENSRITHIIWKKRFTRPLRFNCVIKDHNTENNCSNYNNKYCKFYPFLFKHKCMQVIYILPLFLILFSLCFSTLI